VVTLVIMFAVAFYYQLCETSRKMDAKPDPKPKPTQADHDRRLRAVQRGLEARGHQVGLYDASTGEVIVLDQDPNDPGGKSHG
jgi:hypothetical protein